MDKKPKDTPKPEIKNISDKVFKKASSFKDKEKLDEWAKTFGVELDRRQSLDNMKKEFSEVYHE